MFIVPYVADITTVTGKKMIDYCSFYWSDGTNKIKDLGFKKEGWDDTTGTYGSSEPVIGDLVIKNDTQFFQNLAPYTKSLTMTKEVEEGETDEYFDEYKEVSPSSIKSISVTLGSMSGLYATVMDWINKKINSDAATKKYQEYDLLATNDNKFAILIVGTNNRNDLGAADAQTVFYFLNDVQSSGDNLLTVDEDPKVKSNSELVLKSASVRAVNFPVQYTSEVINTY